MALFSASESWSKLNNLPFSESLDKISRECPPPPKVTSTYTPSGLLTKASTLSVSKTGL